MSDKNWSPEDAHFTLFWKNDSYMRLDHWNGDPDELPGSFEDIEKYL